MKDFSKISTPLAKMTQKGEWFMWTFECENSFQKLNTCLTTTLILTLSSGTGGYVIYYDASRVGLGFVLMQ